MAVAMDRPLPLPWSRNACDLDLEQLVDEARDSFRAELAIPLSVARPPKIAERDGHGELEVKIGQGSVIGYSISSQLHKRLGHPNGYGNVFPVARALDDLRGWCRGRHLEASSGPWEDHAADVELLPELQRPLCARLAWAVVAWRATPAWAARQERLPVLRAARLLTSALQHAFEQRREWAHGDTSAVPQVLADIRRQRRTARDRAEASAAATGVVCRDCGGPYEALSITPCPGASTDAALADVYPGAAVLCTPARS